MNSKEKWLKDLDEAIVRGLQAEVDMKSKEPLYYSIERERAQLKAEYYRFSFRKAGLSMDNKKKILNDELFEASLPPYLKKDITALQEGVKTNLRVLDCLYNEVQGSIHSAFYDNEITSKQAAYLWEKYSGLNSEWR